MRPTFVYAGPTTGKTLLSTCNPDTFVDTDAIQKPVKGRIGRGTNEEPRRLEYYKRMYNMLLSITPDMIVLTNEPTHQVDISFTRPLEDVIQKIKERGDTNADAFISRLRSSYYQPKHGFVMTKDQHLSDFLKEIFAVRRQTEATRV